MNMFVVTRTSPAYGTEDGWNTHVMGVFTDKVKAEKWVEKQRKTARSSAQFDVVGPTVVNNPSGETVG